MKPQIHLGIDIGYATLGWGVIRRTGSEIELLSYDVIVTSPKDIYEERLKQLHSSIRELCNAWQPDCIAMEQPHLVRARTSFEVFSAAGVVRLSLYEAGYTCLMIGPSEMKKAITGRGNCKKDEIRAALKARFNLATMHKKDDAWDGLGVAIALGELGVLQAAA